MTTERSVVLRAPLCPRLAGIGFVLSLGVATPLVAQDAAPGDPNAPSRSLQDAVVVAVQADAAAAASSVPAVAARPKRPAALVPLYVSYGALQALDIQSTARALGRGGTEANPVMKGIAGITVALFAVKAGAGAAVIFASEKMWPAQLPSRTVEASRTMVLGFLGFRF